MPTMMSIRRQCLLNTLLTVSKFNLARPCTGLWGILAGIRRDCQLDGWLGAVMIVLNERYQPFDL
ncbi:hypothetical protein ES703_78004 [subsurface metagenome]